MGVTSVVTYTFSIGSFSASPWSRYGTSVDWGVKHILEKIYYVYGGVEYCN